MIVLSIKNIIENWSIKEQRQIKICNFLQWIYFKLAKQFFRLHIVVYISGYL